MKRVVFHWMVLILLGLVLVGVLEMGLRILVDLPAPPGATTWTRIDPFREVEGGHVLQEVFLGTLRPASLPSPKAKGVTRIFCFGGSTTYGYPWPPEDAWPAALERRLRALYPERGIEVVNLGGTSYGSSRVLGLMRGALRYEPDLFIAVFGHNEFVEDSYQTAVVLPVEATGYLRSFHLYRVLELVLGHRDSLLRSVSVQPGDTTAGFFFSPQLDGTIYTATPSRRQEVLARFTRNVAAVIDLSRTAGVPLVLATEPAGVLTWPPERDLSAPAEPATRAEWERLKATGEEREGQGQIDRALESYSEAARLWGGNASLAYRVGSLLLTEGRRVEAIPLLERARDLDPAPVRALSALHESLRSAARASGVPLVDGYQAFLDMAIDSVREEELVLDHVHLTVLGNYLFSRAVWSAMTGLPGWEGYETEREALLSQEEERDARIARPHNPKLAYVWGQIYAHKGLTDRAEEMFREASTAGGGNRKYAGLALAQVLFRQGRTLEAWTIVEELAIKYPDFPEPWPLLGRLREMGGDRCGAIEAYRASLDAGNLNRNLAAHLAEILVDVGHREEAIVVLEPVYRAHPGDAQLESLMKRVWSTEGSVTPLCPPKQGFYDPKEGRRLAPGE